MRRPKWHVLFVVGVGGWCLLGPPYFGGPEPALSLDQDVQRLYDLARSGIGGSRRLAALEKLRTMESADAGTALAALAESKDDALAAQALSALARSDHAEAEGTLEDVFEDADRSSAARGAALTAWCERRKQDGDSWGDVEEYVEEKANEDEALLAVAAAVKAARFEKGGN